MGEDWNFEQSTFRIANTSNLKIKERSNVERLNSRVTAIENENWKYKASRANMRIGKIASSAEYRIDKQFQNLLIFGISISKLKKFGKFVNFSSFKILEIPKISNLKNFLNF